MAVCIFFFQGYGDHRDLHSFPTRRSSDLELWSILNQPPVVIDTTGDNNGLSLVVVAEHAEGLQRVPRSEEHRSELQSPDHLVCRLLLEKKKKRNTTALSLTEHRNYTACHR